MLGRFLVSRPVLAALDLAILVPTALTIAELAHLLYGAPWSTDQHAATHEAEELIEGVGVVLIGWGVALEERRGVSRLLRAPAPSNPVADDAINDICHHYGLALLLLGLFAEIAMECVRLPDRIIDTRAIERIPLTIAALFLALGVYALLAHIVRMALLRPPAH